MARIIIITLFSLATLYGGYLIGSDKEKRPIGVLIVLVGIIGCAVTLTLMD